MKNITHSKKIHTIFFVLILVFVGLLTYSSAILNPFVHDDIVFIKNNPFISDLNLKNFIIRTSARDNSFPIINIYYRPFLELFNRIVYKLFGANASVFHFVNILLHILNSILAFFVVKLILTKNKILLKGAPYFSFVVSILFLTHPINTEAVACISGVSNLLFCFFVLLSFFLYLKSSNVSLAVKSKKAGKSEQRVDKLDESALEPSKNVSKKQKGKETVLFLSREAIKSNPLLARHLKDDPSRESTESRIEAIHHPRNIILYVLSLVVFIFAMFSKEQAVVLPAIFLLYELCFARNKRKALKANWPFIAGYVLIVLAYFIIRKSLFGQALTSDTIFNEEFGLRILSIPSTILMYLGLLIFPVKLHYYRSTNMLEPFLVPSIFLLIILFASALIARFLSKEEKKLFFFAFGLFFLSLLPVLNIVPIVNEYSFLLTSEHFLYVPSLAFVLFFTVALGALTRKLFGKRNFVFNGIMIFVLIAAFSFLTFRQNKMWSSEIALFEKTVEYEPRFGRARMLLGDAYLKEKKYKQAIEQYKVLIEIMENYLRKVEKEEPKRFYLSFLIPGYEGLAKSYDSMGEHRKAIETYYKLLSYNQNTRNYFKMGLVFVKLKDLHKASEYFKKAFDADNRNLMAASNLGLCLRDLGKMREAEKYFRYVVEQDPRSASAQKNLNSVLNENQF